MVQSRNKKAFRRIASFRRGAALLFALIFMVILVSLALTLSVETSDSLQITQSYETVYKARVSAESGLEYLMMQLRAEKFQFEG